MSHNADRGHQVAQDTNWQGYVMVLSETLTASSCNEMRNKMEYLARSLLILPKKING